MSKASAASSLDSENETKRGTMKKDRSEPKTTERERELETEEAMQGTTETETTGEPIPSLILASDKHWKVIYIWMVKNNVEFRSKVTRDGGLHVSPKNERGYRKLQDNLQKENIHYHTYGMENQT